MRIDINDKVKVKVSSFGWQIYGLEYRKLHDMYPTTRPEEDAEGRSEWPLYRLIQIFGKYLVPGHGENLVMEPIIETIPQKNNGEWP